MTRPARAAQAALTIAVGALAFAALVRATGGFETTVFGLPFKSRDPGRAVAVSAIAFAVFAYLYGIRRLGDRLMDTGRALNQSLAERRIHGPIVAVLALAVLIFGWYFGSCIAGGADTYGYLSQAQLWRQGLPVIAQPFAADAPWPLANWTFAPLGYRAADSEWAIVPMYAAGLPMLMAAVQWAAGYPAAFWIVPLAGAALVLVTYGLGCRLGSPHAGLMAAWLMATNETLLSEVRAPMSDVVLAAALGAGVYCLFRTGGPAVVRAGIACALAVLVRPNLAPTVFVLAVWLGSRPAFNRSIAWPHAVRNAVIFLVAAAPGFIVPAWANWRLYGSPFTSGYGDLAAIYDQGYVLSNLRQYPLLLVRAHAELAFVGLAVLLLPFKRIWPAVGCRSIFVGIALFVASIIVQYLAYEPASNPGYLRFLLPCAPLVMVGVAQLASRAARPGWQTALVGLAIVAVGVRSLHGMYQAGGFDLNSERKYPGVAAIVRAHTEPDSVILSMQHSGTIRYYSGHLTLRYDLLNEQWLDRSIDWLAHRGVHTYAVLDDWEVPMMRSRFAGQARVTQLDAPVFIYRGAAVTHVYDLVRPPIDRPATITVVDTFQGPRCVPPVSMPQRIDWRRG
jgi:hypothetical protein